MLASRKYTKGEFIVELRKIRDMGWIPSHRSKTNVGSVGNTLEDLLGIKENNLPIANAGAWELKAQRRESGSLTTLFHFEPFPREKIVERVLLPKYGWPHATKAKENSFRQTISAVSYTDRGFKVVVDRDQNLVRIDFAHAQTDPKHAQWLETVKLRVGLGTINPVPQWPFDLLEKITQKKLTNSFYIEAESRATNEKEEFEYNSCVMLGHFDFSRFLEAIEKGTVLVDFDASSSHNHGTKFRMRRNMWNDFYGIVQQIF